jgi:hypothetical protein
MNLEVVVPYLAGPGAAVIVLLLVGAGVYRLIVNYGMPLLEGVIDRHMTELERASQRHEEAVARHMAHIGKMGERYDRLAEQHATEHRKILEAIEELARLNTTT